MRESGLKDLGILDGLNMAETGCTVVGEASEGECGMRTAESESRHARNSSLGISAPKEKKYDVRVFVVVDKDGGVQR